MTNPTKPSEGCENAILYIIMRRDLGSMNTGKAIAQGSHAANAAVKDAYNHDRTLYETWTEQTNQGFGTVLVLEAANMALIDEILDEVSMISVVASLAKNRAVAGKVFDPTYPLRDGQFTHYIPLETCAYVMCFKGSKVHDLMTARKADFPLHR